MTLGQLLNYAYDHNLMLAVSGSDLTLTGSRSAANDTFIAELKKNKAEIISLLSCWESVGAGRYVMFNGKLHWKSEPINPWHVH